ncbi:VOC family protein [Herbiconiux daphne]|uniref:VOC family protein n=1 Tax=Herbiconiux daphne TaxID=2970914 RepID=A0ABT2H3J0_9MICO|nr:VOC family protein [Herbiconiux daphne]MCS5734504.1 VOC family protein [Herbiconiux daphne]
MRWNLEVVPVSVTDLDAAKKLYEEQVGFHVDLDIDLSQEVRIVQLTPPGSASSIQLRQGATRVDGLQLTVDDIDVARKQLVDQAVDVSTVQHFEGGERREGRGGEWNSFLFFSDPDGNAWVVQERPAER